MGGGGQRLDASFRPGYIQKTESTTAIKLVRGDLM